MDTTRDMVAGVRVTDVRCGELELPGVLVELTGELDIRDLEPIQRTLDDALGSGLPTYVDLSKVTFLDARCTRELAVQYRLFGTYGGLLALRAPSWQATASFRACGFGHLVGPYLDEERPHQVEAYERAKEECDEALALAV